MGILNVTPDSFSDGGKFVSVDVALAHAIQMIAEGADIIDVGGESTRPGSESVSPEKEKARVLPVIRVIRDRFPSIPISIDTQKADVASVALDAGADVVNDVSALRNDRRMARLVGEREVPVILMHMQGMPKTMQNAPHYSDVVREVIDFLRRQMDLGEASGISRSKIIVDPGIGFGKTLDHNIEIFRRLEEMQGLCAPILIGHSRKAMIGTLMGDLPPEKRLEGTLAVGVLAADRGAHILRVHDVGAMVKALVVAGRLREEVPVRQ